MKNITVAEICARIDGMDRLTMSRSFSRCVIVRPSRMYESRSFFATELFVVVELVISQ